MGCTEHGYEVGVRVTRRFSAFEFILVQKEEGDGEGKEEEEEEEEEEKGRKERKKGGREVEREFLKFGFFVCLFFKGWGYGSVISLQV